MSISSAARVATKNFDVVVVGGGVMGLSTAFHLASSSPTTSVAVVERDWTYTHASTPLSVSSIRQQFSNHENVAMSLFSADFIKNADKHLSLTDDDPVDLQFQEQGYLFLATPRGVPILQENHATQRAAGAEIDLLTADELVAKFPWLNTEDIALGGYGVANEGWFDPWSLLSALRKKSASLGVTLIEGSVSAVSSHQATTTGPRTVDSVTVTGPDGDTTLSGGTFVSSCGAWASSVARMVGIEDLPVFPRKRCVFGFDTAEPVPNLPLMVDPTGVYVRPEGSGFLCGKSPSEGCDPDYPDDESSCELLQVTASDFSWFEEELWPALAHRVPRFEALKPTHSWSGYYEFNTFDANGFIGRHDDVTNMLFATGFSGHGIQQSPAVGCALSELILHNEYRTIDLSRMRADRYRNGQEAQVLEKNIV